MILRTNSKLKNQTRQSGVTLLLAILILASIMAISFSLATILLIEVRTSGDVVRTEDAWYGTSAISEEALFNIKRNVSSSTYDTLVGNVSLTTAQPTLNDNIIQVSVPPNASFTGTASHFPIYNPTCPSPNPASSNQTCQLGGSGYGAIKLTYLNTGNPANANLQVYLCQFDPREGTDPSHSNSNTYGSAVCSNINDVGGTYGSIVQDNYWQTQAPGGDALTPSSFHAWSLNPSQQQELILVNPTNSYIYVQIESFASDGTTRQGLPFFQQKVVDVTGSNAGVNRRVRIQVPVTVNNSSSPVNIAQGKSASQISTYDPSVSYAAKAVDGNTDGLYGDGSVTHTAGGATDWWEVDLGASVNISSIVVWNRTDCCQSRLTDYYVFVSNTPFNDSDPNTPGDLVGASGVWNNRQASYPSPSTSLQVNATGRYVRIQLSGSANNNYGGYFLSLAEVQVFGQ
jgi:hypothetical protein